MRFLRRNPRRLAHRLPIDQRRIGPARTQTVDRDPVRRHIVGQGAGEPDQPVLRRRIRQRPARALRVTRSNRQDPAVPRVPHVRQRLARRPVGRGQIQRQIRLEHVIVVAERILRAAQRRPAADVVDQNVAGTKLGDRPAHRLLRLLSIQRVGDHRQAPRTDLLDFRDHRVQLRLRPRRNHDLRALTRHLQRDRPANPASAAGHDRRLTIQAAHNRSPSLRWPGVRIGDAALS